MTRSRYLLLARWSLAAALLVAVPFVVDVRVVLRTLAGVEVAYLVPALVLSALHPFLAASRWHALCAATGHGITLRHCVETNLHGSFLQNFTPGGVGLDALRVVRNSGVPRLLLLGLTAFDKAMLAAVAVGLYGVSLVTDDGFAAAVVGIIAAIAIGLWTVAVSGSRFLPLLSFGRLGRPTVRHGALWRGIVLANVSIGNFCLIAACVFAGLREPMRLEAIIGFPVSVMISSIPLSPGGFGVREWSAVITLEGRGGLTAEALVAGSAVFGATILVATSLVSASFFLLSKQQDIRNRTRAP